MVRASLRLLLLCVALAGCSRGDLTTLAENVRIRAENIGAEAEFRRQTALSASQEHGTIYVPQEKEGLAQPADAEKAAPEKKAPPPPPTVYVIVPAS
jgi:hypothetical protein